MIRSLVLENFRLHSHTELRFESDGQIILVAGGNGVGKSTLLEAILFALYGEGRHGKRNLDLLVRRGAELEGMSVELVFELDQTTYRINRRRDGRAVTAVLYGNEIPLMEGPNAVTDAVVRLLGMDAVGFKVAVIAQQKDLDGLASLRPAERSAAVRRLLRLDALTAAKELAQTSFRHERDLVRELRPGVSDDVAGERDRILSIRETAAAELLRCTEVVDALRIELEASADVEALWNLAVANRDRAISAVRDAERDLLALTTTRDELDIPAEPDNTDDVEALVSEISVIERALAEAESSARNREQRVLVETELSRVRTRISATVVADHAELRSSKALADGDVAAAHDLISAAEIRLEEFKSAFHRAVADRDAIREQIERLNQAGAMCDTCGQEISDEHREAHGNELVVALENADSTVNELTAAGRACTDERNTARTALDAARSRSAEVIELIAQAQRDADELAELHRRESTYADQLDRLVVTDVDVNALAQNRRSLDVRLSGARDAARIRGNRAVVLARAEELDRSIAAAGARRDQANVDAASSEVGGDLEVRNRERVALRARHDEELALLQYWERETLLAGERLVAADAVLERRVALERRIANHETKALDASNAALLLGDAADRLATRIRPMLEGSMSSLLATMSAGRFDSVRIDDDYNVTVSDAGSFRALGELSGGEVDLVALALRLALSQAVADRAGSGARFLILDECFGSQDPERRASVMSALRGLRDTYRQIFLISHVENIEDSADVVIRVETAEDRSEAEVTIS
jgi:exonuclease SbcC